MPCLSSTLNYQLSTLRTHWPPPPTPASPATSSAPSQAAPSSVGSPCLGSGHDHHARNEGWPRTGTGYGSRRRCEIRSLSPFLPTPRPSAEFVKFVNSYHSRTPTLTVRLSAYGGLACNLGTVPDSPPGCRYDASLCGIRGLVRLRRAEPASRLPRPWPSSTFHYLLSTLTPPPTRARVAYLSYNRH
jgi:hypothetical protein